MKKSFLFLLLLLMPVFTFQVLCKTYLLAKPVQSDNLPVPDDVKNLLFYVQRSTDANTVVYQLNLGKDGKLNEADPVRSFWIRYSEKGERRELNYIQRKFGFGLNVKKLEKDHYELSFVSYDKQKLYLRKNSQGLYQVHTITNKKAIILNRVFLQIEGGTFWVPNVVYIELKGLEPKTGDIITDRIKP